MSWRRISIKPEDVAFSLCVRERAQWACERCGKHFDRGARSLQCSHWISRAKLATRWHPRNAFAHCVACHVWFGLHEGYDKWRVWMLSPYLVRPYTAAELDKLFVLSQSTMKAGKLLRKAIAKHYKAEYERLCREHDQEYAVRMYPLSLELKNWTDADLKPYLKEACAT